MWYGCHPDHIVLECVLSRTSRNSCPWLPSGAGDAAWQVQARAVAVPCIVQHQRCPRCRFRRRAVIARSSFFCKVAMTTSCTDALHEALKALAESRLRWTVFTGLAGTSRSGPFRTQPRLLALLFSGPSSRRHGMGQRLCTRFPRFDAAFREVCKERTCSQSPRCSEAIHSSIGISASRVTCASWSVPIPPRRPSSPSGWPSTAF